VSDTLCTRQVVEMVSGTICTAAVVKRVSGTIFASVYEPVATEADDDYKSN